MPADSSTFAIDVVSYFAESFLVAESSVLRINIFGEYPAQRKSAKRYQQAYKSLKNNTIAQKQKKNYF